MKFGRNYWWLVNHILILYESKLLNIPTKCGLTPQCTLSVKILTIVNFIFGHPVEQFLGSITNLTVFRAKNDTLLRRLSENPCYFSSGEEILSWSSINWNISENVLQTTIDKRSLCFVSDYFNLRLPFLWDYYNAKYFCSKLGEGKISEFRNPSNLSNLNLEEMYGSRFSECGGFWTPYTDEIEEGIFINENSGKVER